MPATDGPLRALAASRPRWIQHLAEFVSIPSVSSEHRHAEDVRRAAAWLKARLREAGIPSTSLIETSGAPLVWGEWPVSRGAPTVLMYGHYDVVSLAASDRGARRPSFRSSAASSCTDAVPPMTKGRC